MFFESHQVAQRPENFYAIGETARLFVGDDDEHFFVTHPPVGTARPTRVWVVGDSGTGNSHVRAVRDAYYDYTGERHTDLWLLPGLVCVTVEANGCGKTALRNELGG